MPPPGTQHRTGSPGTPPRLCLHGGPLPQDSRAGVRARGPTRSCSHELVRDDSACPIKERQRQRDPVHTSLSSLGRPCGIRPRHSFPPPPACRSGLSHAERPLKRIYQEALNPTRSRTWFRPQPGVCLPSSQGTQCPAVLRGRLSSDRGRCLPRGLSDQHVKPAAGLARLRVSVFL